MGGLSWLNIDLFNMGKEVEEKNLNFYLKPS